MACCWRDSARLARHRKPFSASQDMNCKSFFLEVHFHGWKMQLESKGNRKHMESLWPRSVALPVERRQARMVKPVQLAEPRCRHSQRNKVRGRASRTPLLITF